MEVSQGVLGVLSEGRSRTMMITMLPILDNCNTSRKCCVISYLWVEVYYKIIRDPFFQVPPHTRYPHYPGPASRGGRKARWFPWALIYFPAAVTPRSSCSFRTRFPSCCCPCRRTRSPPLSTPRATAQTWKVSECAHSG